MRYADCLRAMIVSPMSMKLQVTTRFRIRKVSIVDRILQARSKDWYLLGYWKNVTSIKNKLRSMKLGMDNGMHHLGNITNRGNLRPKERIKINGMTSDAF